MKERIKIMKAKLLISSICLGAGLSHAGGIENTYLPVDQLFVEGSNVIHAAYSWSKTDASGDTAFGTQTGTGSNGDYSPKLSYKHQLTDDISTLVAYHLPLQADISYAKAGLYQGTKAKYESESLSALVNMNLGNGFGVHGGVQLVSTKTSAQLRFDKTITAQLPTGEIPDYDVKSSSSQTTGYILGASYAIPEIALLARFTYESEVKQDLDLTEKSALFQLLGGPSDTKSTQTTTSVPEVMTLSLESGVAENTLAFASVRHVKWSKFSLAPTGYAGAFGGELVSFDKDTTALEIGVGHMLNDQWSVAAFLGYEKASGGVATALAPDDGYQGGGMGATFTVNQNLAVNAGLAYYESDIDTVDEFQTQFKNMGGPGLSASLDYNF